MNLFEEWVFLDWLSLIRFSRPVKLRSSDWATEFTFCQWSIKLPICFMVLALKVHMPWPFSQPAPPLIETETQRPAYLYAAFSLAPELDQGRLSPAVSTFSSPLSSSPTHFIHPPRSSSLAIAFSCTSNRTWESCSVWTSKSTFALLFQ